MSLTHTDTPISNLVINRFETLAEFESAQQGGLIGQDDISIIDENIQADWNQSNTTAPDYIKNKPTIPTVNDATLTIQKNGTTVDTFTANASVDKTINITVPTSAADVSAIPTSQKGAASGVAELDSNGKVPSSQLPSYVDDVLEYANTAAFPATGESGKIYVALDTNKTYRWGGSEYVEISASLALGETSSTAYRGDRGKTAYDHSQITNGSNPHNTTLSGLTDTTITSPADKQILRYDSSTSKWINSDDVLIATFTESNGTWTCSMSIQDICAAVDDKKTVRTNDVAIYPVGFGTVDAIVLNGETSTDTKYVWFVVNAQRQANGFLGTSTYDSTNQTWTDSWQLVYDAGNIYFDDIVGVSLNSPTSGQVLTYNGSNWSNSDVPTELPSITGNSGKVLTVNSGATGTEWTTPDTGDDLYVEKTYSQLAAMVSGGTLVKGQKYRITDYVTTTAQTNTSSANHAFDLVVTATDTNKLDCMAQAVLHLGDTYFSTAGADLTKWQVWYDINNDTTKYAWADTTNGKGVIYRLIDENGNDCPYDFKNIRFTVSGLTLTAYTANAYTFNLYDGVSTSSDYSLNGQYCYGNVMKPYHVNGVQNLNFNVFYNYSGSLVYYCVSNIFGVDCHSNVFDDACKGNVFGENCNSNVFGQVSSNNSFGNGCYSNTLELASSENSFGFFCHSNTIGINSNYNSFGNNCNSNILTQYCENNTFGNGCDNIVFGNNIVTPVLDGNRYKNNIIENGNRYIRLYQSGSSYLQNVYIAQGVNNATTWLDISTIARNLSYRTTVARLSDGTIRIYKEDEDDMLPSITGNAGKVLTVNSGATGTEWTTPTSSLAGLSDTTITTPANGQILSYDNTTSKWINSAAPSGTLPSQTGNTGKFLTTDGTDASWSDISHDIAHDSNQSVSSPVTVTFAANQRGSKMITVSANVNITLTVNNLSDNYLWVKNSGSSAIDVTIAAISNSTLGTITSMYLPTDGISVEGGKVCEIGIVVNADGAFITCRNDLELTTLS